MIKIKIKGPPGSGKSAILGEIARHLKSLGLDVRCYDEGTGPLSVDPRSIPAPAGDWESRKVQIEAKQ
jgi:hypothetical protein